MANETKQLFKVGKKSDVQPNERRVFWAGGRKILVYNINGSYYATDESCPHRECSMAEALLSNTEITCPCHAAKFDIATGEVLSPPTGGDSTLPLPTYPVSIDVHNNIVVEIDTSDLID